MQVDRIISRVKALDYSDARSQDVKQVSNEVKDKPKQITTNKPIDTRVIVINIIDVMNKAAKLKDIQAEYYKITGSHYNIRETMRTLNRAKIVLMIRQKDSHRGVMWVRSSWVVDGDLMPEHKPEGFDLFYTPDSLIYE
jgi:hypothetical protein